MAADVLRWEDADLDVQRDGNVDHPLGQPGTVVVVVGKLMLIFILRVTDVACNDGGLCVRNRRVQIR